MEFICPVLDHGDFIAIGKLKKIKISVLQAWCPYHEGCKYLEISDYEPNEVFIQLFKDIAKKDDEFTGIIVNIPNEKKDYR